MSNLETHLAAAGAAAALVIHAWQAWRAPVVRVFQTLQANGGIKGIALTVWRGKQQEQPKP